MSAGRPDGGTRYIPDDQAPDARLEARRRDDRRATLGAALRHARAYGLGAAGLVELVDLLGLGEELDELAGGYEGRLEAIAEARAGLAPRAPVSDGT